MNNFDCLMFEELYKNMMLLKTVFFLAQHYYNWSYIGGKRWKMDLSNLLMGSKGAKTLFDRLIQHLNLID